MRRLFALLLWLSGLPAAAQTVSTPAELVTALQQARGGEQISLAPGDYGRLELTQYQRFAVSFPSPVTLRSADPARPARFSGMALSTAGNLVLEGLDFTAAYRPGDSLEATPFRVIDSHAITFRNNRFTGALATAGKPEDIGLPTAIGLQIRSSADITVDGNRIARFYRGLMVVQSDRVAITENEVVGCRSDGMDFAADQGLTITGNRIHAFRKETGTYDHPDMIQFWTRGTHRPTTDVVIRGNFLLAEGHGFTQSIFIRNEEVDEGRAGAGMYYRNLTIADNVIVNAHIHGITVGEADGLTIRNNTLIHDAASDGRRVNPPLWRPRIEVKATNRNVTLTGNAAAAVTGPAGQPDWQVAGNVIIQDTDPGRPGYYDTVFLSPRAGRADDLGRWVYRPGGPLDGLTAGSPLLRGP